MNREARGVILALVAIMLLRLSLTDDHLLYVKSSMRPWLVVSGGLLAVLAVVDFFGWLSRPAHGSHPDGSAVAPGPDATGAPDAEDDHASHRHGYLPWILVTPFIVVFAIGPSPLGAFMAERQVTTERINTEGAAGPVAADTGGTAVVNDASTDAAGPGGSSGATYPPPPPPVDGAVEMHIADFVSRAAYDDQRQMQGVLVRLEGFVTPDADGPGDTFLLTKFMLSCCAADGLPVSVRVRGLTPIPPADTWLRVEGYWIPHAGNALPPVDEFDLLTSEEIPVPEDPYL